MHALSVLLAVAGVSAAAPPVDPALFKRQSQTPPSTAHPDSLPGQAFAADYGMDGAIAAAPAWNFGRSWGREPCYPESAIVDGGPNPGNEPGLPTSPGDGCQSPGAWNGVFSPGNPFPTYISAMYCTFPNNPPEWRVGYNIYYPHDAGHKHDWEWMIVAWRQPDPNIDWWDRDSAILSFHKTNHQLKWGDMITLWGDGTDWSEMRTGLYRHHPRVFSDFWKHANFPDKDTSMNTMAADEMMFRSNDWVHMPVAEDMEHFDVIDSNWDYGDATSTPPWLHNNLCTQ